MVFLDADVTNLSPPGFVTALLVPILVDESLHLVKAAYRRSLNGHAEQGGRATELLPKPFLRRFFPDLTAVSQPLAGECARRRSALDGMALADGYGIEIGLLIDVYRRRGLDAVAEVHLGERVHRNHPLRRPPSALPSVRRGGPDPSPRFFPTHTAVWCARFIAPW